MNIDDKTVEFIKTYIDDEYIYIERLIDYLTIHDVVGNEIFMYVDKMNNVAERYRESYCCLLDISKGYMPVSTETFIRRIPFYFYFDHEYNYLFDDFVKDINDSDGLEELYKSFEYLFYDKGISVETIFSYPSDQCNVNTLAALRIWIKYLKLLDSNSYDDYLPERLITEYNLLLEKKGLKPIIYYPVEFTDGNIYMRHGNEFYFNGVFPCDKNGEPILRWIGIKLKNVRSAILCNCKKSNVGYISFNISPDSLVYAVTSINQDKKPYWEQVYAGPRQMEFNYIALKSWRKFWNMTQKDVAEAVGTSVRTYQKWENGDTKPDGYFLIRLINWLQIDNIQELVNVKDEIEEIRGRLND